MNTEKLLQHIFKDLSDDLYINGDVITIYDKQYSEITDYNLEFNFYDITVGNYRYGLDLPSYKNINLNNIDSLLDAAIECPHIEDSIERESIINNACDILSEMNIDINSRRCVLQPKNILNKPACPSFIQFLYRDGIAYIFVKYRSQNLTNFLYDFQTNIALVKLLKNKILNLDKNISNIFLRINTTSFHKSI